MSAIKEKRLKETDVLSQVKLPDPINESIQERKDYGSYLSVIKNKVDPNAQDREVFTLSLQGKGISNKHMKMTAQEMLDSGDFNIAVASTKRDMQFQSVQSPNNIARRKISDRKKSARKSSVSTSSDVENYKPTE